MVGSTSNYVEIPLNVSGGKLCAHKTMKRKGEKTIFERIKPECMLVFEQKIGQKSVDCYMVTLIGAKSYIKKHKKKMKTMRHLPDDNAFTGVWYSLILADVSSPPIITPMEREPTRFSELHTSNNPSILKIMTFFL